MKPRNWPADQPRKTTRLSYRELEAIVEALNNALAGPLEAENDADEELKRAAYESAQRKMQAQLAKR